MMCLENFMKIFGSTMEGKMSPKQETVQPSSAEKQSILGDLRKIIDERKASQPQQKVVTG